MSDEVGVRKGSSSNLLRTHVLSRAFKPLRSEREGETDDEMYVTYSVSGYT